MESVCRRSGTPHVQSTPKKVGKYYANERNKTAKSLNYCVFLHVFLLLFSLEKEFLIDLGRFRVSQKYLEPVAFQWF